MAVYWPTPDFKGRTFKLCVLTRWDFNFCVRSSPLRGYHDAVGIIYQFCDSNQETSTTLLDCLHAQPEESDSNVLFILTQETGYSVCYPCQIRRQSTKIVSAVWNTSWNNYVRLGTPQPLCLQAALQRVNSKWWQRRNDCFPDWMGL